MTVFQPTLPMMVRPFQEFHKRAGYCGYTLRHSLETFTVALQDPTQFLRAVSADLGNGTFGVVSYIWATLERDHAHLYQMWTDPSVRGSRAASMCLLAEVEAWARANGANELRANTSRLNRLKSIQKQFGLKPYFVQVRKAL